MKKTIVVDTNVALEDPHFDKNFKGVDIVVPVYSLEEVDNLKKFPDSTGRNAREFSRHLDKLCDEGDLSKGISIGNGNTLRVEHEHLPISGTFKCNYDCLILGVAKWLKENKRKDVLFITNDTNLRIRANLSGIKSKSYHESFSNFDFYQGYSEEHVISDDISDIYRDQSLTYEDAEDLHRNEFLLLKDQCDPKRSALARHIEGGKCELIKSGNAPVFGLTPKNVKQRFALHALMDPSIQLVALAGPAGTGKTLVACAAGLEQVTHHKIYEKLLVSRPIVPMGREMGFLPGDIDEKMDPWMKPIHDNVAFLTKASGAKPQEAIRHLVDKGFLQIEPLTYIRGRSIHKQFLLIDEAQNLTKHEIKTILTRAGKGTKVVLTGDPYQIDCPRLDKRNNGLIYAINKFKNEAIAASIVLDETERSELASIAAKLL
jgi:PhoH-like ATPase